MISRPRGERPRDDVVGEHAEPKADERPAGADHDRLAKDEPDDPAPAPADHGKQAELLPALDHCHRHRVDDDDRAEEHRKHGDDDGRLGNHRAVGVDARDLSGVAQRRGARYGAFDGAFDGRVPIPRRHQDRHHADRIGPSRQLFDAAAREEVGDTRDAEASLERALDLAEPDG